MADLRLRDGVHLCDAGASFVILDLPNDRYLALAPLEAEAMRAALSASTGRPITQTTGAETARSGEGLQSLLDAGIVTADTIHGRPLTTTAWPPAEASILEDARRDEGRLTASRAIRFVTAAIAAERRLRRRPLHETVEHVRARRLDAQERSSCRCDFSAVRDLSAAFGRLRPLHPSARRCLFDSLALVEFLALYQVHPVWTFGVRLDPWMAHCWVELDGVLLNETLEKAAQFTPIMTA